MRIKEQETRLTLQERDDDDDDDDDDDERSGERGAHGTSPKREMSCAGNMFRTIVIDSFAMCAVAPSC